MSISPDATPHLVRTLSRRRLLALLAAVPAAGAVLAACGDDTAEPADTTGDTVPDTTTPDTTPSGGIAHPSEPTEAVLRYGYSGGFVMEGYDFARVPTLLIAGDGKVYRPGVMTMEYPGPMIGPITVSTITEAGIQTLLAEADSRGLLTPPAPDYVLENPMIADAPNTDVELFANGTSVLHSAYALGIATPNQEEELTPARQTLFEYTKLLDDLAGTVGADQLGAEEMYVPAAFRVRARATQPGELDGFEPAPSVVDWPASTGVRLADASTCATLTAEQAGTVLTDAKQNTYFREDDVVYFVAAAVVLPGDKVC
jgi:hypothetical protein